MCVTANVFDLFLWLEPDTLPNTLHVLTFSVLLAFLWVTYYDVPPIITVQTEGTEKINILPSLRDSGAVNTTHGGSLARLAFGSPCHIAFSLLLSLSLPSSFSQNTVGSNTWFQFGKIRLYVWPRQTRFISSGKKAHVKAIYVSLKC